MYSRTFIKLSYLREFILWVQVFSILLSSIFHGRLRNRSSRVLIAVAFSKPYLHSASKKFNQKLKYESIQRLV